MPMDILIYAGVAVVLVVWLLRTIGTRNGEERQRPNPFAATPITQDPRQNTEQTVRLDLPKGMPRNLETGLVQISVADAAFDARRFTEQAKDAFLFVVDAFAKGDRETLRDLLAPAVYTHFEREITTREQAGETLQTEVRAFQGADIVEASLNGSQAVVAIRFKVEEIYAVLAADGTVRAGDKTRVVALTDIWTFTRDTASRDPRWFVSATRPDTTADEARAG